MRNELKEAFDRIEADSRLKESTKQFLQKKGTGKSRWSFRPVVQRTLAAACILFFVVLGIGGYSWIQTPVSYVSIDVNPSIELALNRFDRVLSATAYNPEGEEILKNLSLKGKKYGAAIDALMESDVLKPYLTEDAELVLTVAAEKQREQSLLTEGEHCLRHAGYSSYSSYGVSADMALVSAAHDNGLSLGKYYAYLQLLRYDETVTPDSCRDMSMSTIHELIDEHEHGGSHEESQQNENGSGHHRQPEGISDQYEETPEEIPDQYEEAPKESSGHHSHENHH